MTRSRISFDHRWTAGAKNRLKTGPSDTNFIFSGVWTASVRIYGDIKKRRGCIGSLDWICHPFDRKRWKKKLRTQPSTLYCDTLLNGREGIHLSTKTTNISKKTRHSGSFSLLPRPDFYSSSSLLGHVFPYQRQEKERKGIQVSWRVLSVLWVDLLFDSEDTRLGGED